MPDAKLKLENGEIVIANGITTIGRTSDNSIAFPGDSNVSRFHAEIEFRDGDHYLIDLNSSNGTTVNGARLRGETRLENGDKIMFGGSSEATFLFGDVSAANESEVDAGETPGMAEASSELNSATSSAKSEAESLARNAVDDAAQNALGGDAANAVAAAPTASGSNPVVLVAGAVCGIAILCAVAAGVFFATRASACAASATIVKPESGDNIKAPTEIEIRVENGECVQRAVFTIDGEEVASAGGPAFMATIDPKDHPELADGDDHSLQVVLIDVSGATIPQAGGVQLALDTRAVSKPVATPTVSNSNTAPIKATTAKEVSLIQMQEMAQRLVNQFSGKFAYNVSNKQLLQEVRKRTAEYAQEGFSQRAAAYRDVINLGFVREQNLDAPLGFVLAMSRSKFNAAKQGDDEGLWRMTNAFVNDSKYNGQCGTETLSDASQNCAAKAAGIYMKALVLGVFEGDVVYSAAAFGKTTSDAGLWKSSLPQDRTDIWNVIRTPAEREQMLRFFAAGIVAENPQAFGLSKDRPLSELYRVTM